MLAQTQKEETTDFSDFIFKSAFLRNKSLKVMHKESLGRQSNKNKMSRNSPVCGNQVDYVVVSIDGVA